MIKDIRVLTKSIQKATIVAFVVIFIAVTLIWVTIYKQEISFRQNKQQQIQASINLFKTELASRLNIIANSQVFINYLRSGKLSRREEKIPFLTKMEALLNTPVIGLEIHRSNSQFLSAGLGALSPKATLYKHNDTILSLGQPSSYFVTLKLCYYGNELNNLYGNCNFLWKLYLNKKQVIQAITKQNDKILHCKSCKKVNIFHGEHFGNFDVASASTLPVGITIQDNHPLVLVLLGLVLILLFILFLWIFLKFTRTIRRHIAQPLTNIITHLKNGRLPNTEQYISEFHYLGNEIKQFYENKDNIEMGKLLGEIAHDLKNYYFSLNAIIKKLEPSKSDKEKIHALTQDIDSMLAALLNRYRPATSAHQSVAAPSYSISSLVIHACDIAEIRCHAENVKLIKIIDKSAYPIFVELNPLLLNRIITNVIQNSIEAHAKVIEVLIQPGKQFVTVTIKDNGKGIPQSILDTIGDKQVTFGKKNGHGLGLMSAKKAIMSWNGDMIVTSKDSQGASIALRLPIAGLTPSTFLSEIRLSQRQHMIIIDDNSDIHEIWQSILPKNIKLTHCYSIIEARSAITRFQQKNAFFLVDYNIEGQSAISGLDLIIEYKLQNNSCLVTSMSEDNHVVSLCLAHGIKLLPKPNINLIPIKS